MVTVAIPGELSLSLHSHWHVNLYFSAIAHLHRLVYIISMPFALTIQNLGNLAERSQNVQWNLEGVRSHNCSHSVMPVCTLPPQRITRQETVNGRQECPVHLRPLLCASHLLPRAAETSQFDFNGVIIDGLAQTQGGNQPRSLLNNEPGKGQRRSIFPRSSDVSSSLSLSTAAVCLAVLPLILRLSALQGLVLV